MKQIFSLIIFGLIFQSGISQKVKELNFQAYFDKYGVDGCFVLYNQSDNEFVRYNSSLCDTGYIPASTFKIPNSLIALEEGVIKDTCCLHGAGLFRHKNKILLLLIIKLCKIFIPGL